jgi:hypothetical protein
MQRSKINGGASHFTFTAGAHSGPDKTQSSSSKRTSLSRPEGGIDFSIRKGWVKITAADG